MRYLVFISITLFFAANKVISQTTISLKISQSGKPVPFATVIIKEINQTFLSDSLGQLTLFLKPGSFTLKIQSFDMFILIFLQ